MQALATNLGVQALRSAKIASWLAARSECGLAGVGPGTSKLSSAAAELSFDVPGPTPASPHSERAASQDAIFAERKACTPRFVARACINGIFCQKTADSDQ